MTEEPEENKGARELEIHFMKTSGYRSYYVDGAFGGITTKGKIYVELYLERSAVPRNVVYRMEENGWTESHREGKEGLVREIECGLIMDVQSAVALRDWLDGRIAEYNEMSVRTTSGEDDE